MSLQFSSVENIYGNKASWFIFRFPYSKNQRRFTSARVLAIHIIGYLMLKLKIGTNLLILLELKQLPVDQHALPSSKIGLYLTHIN